FIGARALSPVRGTVSNRARGGGSPSVGLAATRPTPPALPQPAPAGGEREAHSPPIVEGHLGADLAGENRTVAAHARLVVPVAGVHLPGRPGWQDSSVEALANELGGVSRKWHMSSLRGPDYTASPAISSRPHTAVRRSLLRFLHLRE